MVGAVLAIGFFSFKSCSGKFMGDKPPSVPSLPASAVYTPEPVVKAAVDLEAPTSEAYRFRYRKPPLASEFQNAFPSLTLTVDEFSRVAFVVGSAPAVASAIQYFKEIDTVGGSCAVQAWAVYVDRTAIKGYDLIGALSSVLEGASSSSLALSDSGIVWDISSGEIDLSLAIVADGSVVEVIQRPHVHLEQGTPARIESIQEVPIPNTAVSQGISQTSIQYRKVGLQLEVTPYFLGNERVRLTVLQSNGLLGRNVTIDQNDVPIIETQSVSSTVEMTVGQTLVLGGVSTLRNRKAKGILRDTVELSEGTLYVILSTTSSIPKAVPVSDSIVPDFSDPLPPQYPNPSDWIRSQVLPPKDWRKGLD